MVCGFCQIGVPRGNRSYGNTCLCCLSYTSTPPSIEGRRLGAASAEWVSCKPSMGTGITTARIPLRLRFGRTSILSESVMSIRQVSPASEAGFWVCQWKKLTWTIARSLTGRFGLYPLSRSAYGWPGQSADWAFIVGRPGLSGSVHGLGGTYSAVGTTLPYGSHSRALV